MKNSKIIILITAFVFLLGGTIFTLKKESKVLTISTFGLATTQMKKDVLDPFTEKTGIKNSVQYGDSAARYIQVEHNPHSGIDVMELSQSHTLKAYDNKLIKKLDFNKLKNFKDLLPAQQKLARDTNSIPFTLNSIGIIYNPKKVGDITEWSQLWDPKFKKKIAIPEISTTFGPAMVYLAADYAHSNIEQGDAEAFKALQKLKPNVVKTYSQSSDLTNMFKTGEVDIAIVGDFSVGMIKGSNPELNYVVPQSGTYANYNTISILKNSKNVEEAYKYIDYRISKKIQKRTAAIDSQNQAPTNSKVILNEQESKNKTYGDVAKRAKTIDYHYVNKQLPTWIKKWNKLMN